MRYLSKVLGKNLAALEVLLCDWVSLGTIFFENILDILRGRRSESGHPISERNCVMDGRNGSFTASGIHL
jgi:hypothetical protein